MATASAELDFGAWYWDDNPASSAPTLISTSVRGIPVLLWRWVDVSGNRCRCPSDCPSENDEQDSVLRACFARRHADCDKDNPDNRASDAVCGVGIQPISHLWDTPSCRGVRLESKTNVAMVD